MINDLENFLNKYNLNEKFYKTSKKVDMVDSTAEAMGIESENIIKSLVFIVEGNFYLLICMNKRNIDEDKIKNILNANDIKMTSLFKF